MEISPPELIFETHDLQDHTMLYGEQQAAEDLLHSPVLRSAIALHLGRCIACRNLALELVGEEEVQAIQDLAESA